MKHIAFLSLWIFILFQTSCTTSEPSHEPKKIILKSFSDKVRDVEYDVFIPDNFQNKFLLVLPGWNFSKSSWIENSSLRSLASRFGYALIMPEMKKTLYESSYYPETKMKWNALPGLVFLKDHFFPHLQSRGILQKGQKNFLLGLSTGGRGVALIALDNPGLFTAGASFSGDFSQDLMPKDRLMQLVYGPYESFSERWKGKDNPAHRALEWTMPLYLSHGLLDRIVPESQSSIFYEALKKAGKENLVIYKAVSGKGHDYAFWNAELTPAFEFFEKFNP